MVHVSVVKLVIQFLNLVSMIAVELVNKCRIGDFIIPMLPLLMNHRATSILDSLDADLQPHQTRQ